MPESRINCNLSLPYPNVTQADLNRYDAQMIYTLLAHKLSYVSEYITQCIMLERDYPRLAELIECITLTEMKHFKLLARLLILSGERPDVRSLISRTRRKGVTQRQDSAAEALSFIDSALGEEKSSVSDLRLVLSQLNDKGALRTLKRILADEEHHVDILNNLRQRYS